MPTYDYVCNVCRRLVTMHVRHEHADADRICAGVPTADATYLGLCRGQLVRQPSAPAFVVNGFNAKNGYSK